MFQVVSNAPCSRASRPSRLTNDVDGHGALLTVLHHPLHQLHQHRTLLQHHVLLLHMSVAGSCVLVAKAASAPVGDLHIDEPPMKIFGLGHGRATVENRLEQHFVRREELQWCRQIVEPDRRLIVVAVGPTMLVELLFRVDKQSRQVGSRYSKFFLRVPETERMHSHMCNVLRFICQELPGTSMLSNDFLAIAGVPGVLMRSER